MNGCVRDAVERDDEHDAVCVRPSCLDAPLDDETAAN
jgi:hypothetical protein